MAPLVSVIIPVYNVESYLRECLDSISCQDAEFEVILIDDGSKDNSGAICDEYCANDERFKVYHVENGGPATARNIGLKHACGDWITFVDSDDKIEKGYLSIPKKYGAFDLIYANFSILDPYGVFSPQSWNKDSELISDASHIDSLRLQVFDVYNLPTRRKLGYTCGKFFRRTIIERGSINFPTRLSFYEDACFTWEYFKYVKTLCFVGEMDARYIYRENETSLTQIVNIKSVDRRKNTLSYIDSKIFSPEKVDAFGRFYIDQFFFATKTISKTAKSKSELLKLMASLYRWEPWQKILSKGLFYKGFKPLDKQFFIIKSRLSYLYALKLYLTNGSK